VVTSNNRFITTLAARFGLAYGPWLFYGKAGGGWIGNNDFTITNVTTGASITGFNDTTGGWLLGAGIEWAFVPSWSAKIEYDLLGLEDWTFIVPPGFLGRGGYFHQPQSQRSDVEGGIQLSVWLGLRRPRVRRSGLWRAGVWRPEVRRLLIAGMRSHNQSYSSSA